MSATVTQPNGKVLSSPPTGEPDVMKRRDRRMHDYLVDSLGQSDALRANLGAVSADLMSVSCRLKQAIDQGLGDNSNAIERFGKLTSAFDAYLRLPRQLGRFLELEQRLRDTEERRLAKVR